MSATNSIVKPPLWKLWWLTARPKVLTQSVTPVLAATLLAYSTGKPIQWTLPFFALLAALFVQIGSHFINDALDFEKGADTKTRVGPIRPLQMGLLSVRHVYIGGLICLAAALIAGIPLMLAGGWPLVLALAVSASMAYFYTGGPFPLAYTGLSDLFVFLFYGLCCTISVYYALVLEVNATAILLGSQLGLLSMIMLIVANLRDVQDDTKAQKRTLAVRFGATFSRTQLTMAVLVPFALNIFWWSFGYYFSALLPFLALPFAAKLLFNVWTHEPGPLYNKFLVIAGLLNLSFALLLSLGLLGGTYVG
jgi:1,4-dihydroxy-2-naphthoate octaprenyltransferase